MSCPCDQFNFPARLDITTGLLWLPSALGRFPDWRLAILDAIGRQPALYQWRARGEQDLGMMLIEMGAYVFDIVSFYDAFIANESYIKTSFRDGTDRKLICVLGYVPRPAIAANVWLAAEADGKKVVEVAQGTAFRSGEFDGNAPQVFETEQSVQIDPRVNKHRIERVRLDAMPSSVDSVLVVPNSVRAKENDPVVLIFNNVYRRTAYIEKIEDITLRSREPAQKISFQSAVSVPYASKYSELKVYAPGNNTGLWQFGDPLGYRRADLDSLKPIRTDDIVIFEKEGELRSRRITSVEQKKLTLFTALTSTIKDSSDTVTGTVDSPDIQTTVTRLRLNSNLSGWTDSDADRITVYFNLVEAAKVIVPSKDDLEQTDLIAIPGYIDESRVPVSSLLLEDMHNEGVYSGGALDFINRQATVDTSPEWGKNLVAPVNVFANVFQASRGETVVDEVLGTGDAAETYQEFKLKKKPLTYLQADNAKGYVTTLSVRVGNVLWDEVETFYGTSKEDTVYVVRHDEEDETYIKFGGAARLPSAAVVTASYRFGAGSVVPPAGSVSQLARPVDGIKTVRNILPAFGGGDAESMDEIKYYAPRSALLLGRTVSLLDLEAAAHRVTGVRSVRALWRWDKLRFEQRAIIYYIGDAQLSSSILSSLKAMSEPDAPIDVKQAQSQAAAINLTIVINEDYGPDQVIADVQAALYKKPAPGISGGLLRAEELGPEGVVYNSHVIDTIMDVNGVDEIESIVFNDTPLTGYGRSPDPEHYFDFGELGTASSGITINGVV